MVNDQLKGIRPGYKFGNAFNNDKLIVRPKRQTVEVMSDDNATLKAAWERHAAVPGLVEKEVKGGYEVTAAGQRAFCPYSQIDRTRKEPADYIGRKFDFLVSEYEKDERGLSVVLSRRALLEAEAAERREAALARLVEDETVNGTIVRVLPFGAFVDLDGVEGLLPVSEIAWERVEDPATVLKPGDGVTVKVMRIDREAGRISLSRKECIPRVFHKTPEEIAAEESAAEVAAWMANAEKRNAGFGRGAFDGL